MLRIISKLAQNLSLTSTDQEVLQPYKEIARFVGREVQDRRKEKRNKNRGLGRNDRRYCPRCGGVRVINSRGRMSCPSCYPEKNLPK